MCSSRSPPPIPTTASWARRWATRTLQAPGSKARGRPSRAPRMRAADWGRGGGGGGGAPPRLTLQALKVDEVALVHPGQRSDEGALAPITRGDLDDGAVTCAAWQAAGVDAQRVEQRRDGVEAPRVVVVAGDDDGWYAGAVQLAKERVDQPLRLRRGRRRIEDVAGDEEAVGFLRAGVVEYLLKRRLLLGVAALAAHRAADVPVGGVEEPHKGVPDNRAIGQSGKDMGKRGYRGRSPLTGGLGGVPPSNSVSVAGERARDAQPSCRRARPAVTARCSS